MMSSPQRTDWSKVNFGGVIVLIPMSLLSFLPSLPPPLPGLPSSFLPTEVKASTEFAG